MIIFLASFLSKKKTKLSVPVRIVASIVLVFVPVFLILKQPDFGSASIIIAIWLGMLLVSGINKKNIISLAIVGLAVIFLGSFFLKDYQKNRLANFVSPGNDPLGSGYNVIQSMVAVGSGGLLGKGLGHGSQSQLNFLPEKHTDFIFAVIGEELGLLGAAITLLLFAFIFYRLKEISRLARDNFGFLVTVGVSFMIFSQFFVNIGMNIGLVPVAGVPLPLLSYGGSSLISILASLGIAQSVFLRRLKNY
jgi:rod shape determining protein RodA